MKILKKLCVISTLLVSSAYADDHFYYKNEGELLFKMKAFYDDLDTKPKFDSDITNTGNPGQIVSAAYGVEGSVSYFFNANFAMELGTGVGYMNIKKSEIDKVANAVAEANNTTPGDMDRKDMFMVPFSAIMQYHIAPYGAIRPFVGVGYSAMLLNTRSDQISVSSAHGPVVQVGVDLITRDDTFFTIEAKQYFMDTRLKFDKSLFDTANQSVDSIKSTMKLNPLIISIGFGYKF
ncbi:MAG: hypothetical protein DGJ47_000859 [Rickettsiaceae bacterium]